MLPNLYPRQEFFLMVFTPQYMRLNQDFPAPRLSFLQTGHTDSGQSYADVYRNDVSLHRHPKAPVQSQNMQSMPNRFPSDPDICSSHTQTQEETAFRDRSSYRKIHTERRNANGGKAALSEKLPRYGCTRPGRG
jgi:hypothetical protein